MKVVEVVGGLYTYIQDTDLKKLKKDDLPEKTQVIAQRLVSSHIFDFDGEYYYLREVHLDVE